MGRLTKFKQYLDRLKHTLPTALPIGSQEFDSFAESILSTHNLPMNDSFKHSVATMLLHLDPQTTHRSKAWFAKALKNAQIKETAWFKIEEYKKAQKAAQELKDSMPN